MTTPASRVTELLPCPFCGDQGIPGTTLDNAGYVMCASETCWCMTGYLPTEAEAIAAWNTRSLSDSVSDGSKGVMVEALKEARDKLAGDYGPSSGETLHEAYWSDHDALFVVRKIDAALSPPGSQGEGMTE